MLACVYGHVSVVSFHINMKSGGIRCFFMLMVLSTICNERRATIERLINVIHLKKSRIIATVESLVEAGLVEAIGNGANRSFILSAKVYKQKNESVNYVRQTDIDAVRYPELIIKLAKQQNGIITKENAMDLLKITGDQAYSQIKKLLAEGKLVLNQKGKYANYKIKDKTLKVFQFVCLAVNYQMIGLIAVQSQYSM